MSRKFLFAALVLLTMLPILVCGQHPELYEALLHHPELTLKVTDLSPEQAGEFLERFPGDAVTGQPGTVLLNITAAELDQFLGLGLAFELIGADRDPEVMKVWPSQAGLPEGTWDQYPTYAGYESMMAQFAASYPQLCRIHSIKTLASGRQILFAQLGDDVFDNEAEPVFMYTSSIHGDETAGYVLMLRLIDYLLSNYGTDPVITALMDSVEIWINPLANPDGTYHGGNNSVAQATRRNANNVDLNRNYPDPQDGQHPDGNPWQPETQAFMGMADTIPFTASANFHGGSEVFNYPWDTWSTLPADNDWWVLVGNEYADTCQQNSPSGYFDDFGTGVTNGYAWYTINGGRQDYMNYFRHCREVTIEISMTKLLPANQLDAFWGYNFRSFINFMIQSTYGLHGIVRDSVTHAPLMAKVYISGHDTDSSHVWSDVDNGDYHRLLYAGNYDVTYSAPGYKTRTIPGVTIQNYQQTWLSVNLVPLQPGFAGEDGTVPEIFPQPADAFCIAGVPAGTASWEMINLAGQKLEGASVEDGTTRITIDLRSLPAGIYLFRAVGKEKTTTRRIVVSR